MVKMVGLQFPLACSTVRRVVWLVVVVVELKEGKF